MTADDHQQELEREPFVPLRLRLASGDKIDIAHPGSAFVRRDTLLIVHRLAPKSAAIGTYEVVAPRLIGRVRAPRRRAVARPAAAEGVVTLTVPRRSGIGMTAFACRS